MLLVLGCVQVVTMRYLGMMRGLFMIARLVMLSGFAMVLGGFFVMMRGLFVMLVDLVLLGHFSSPALQCCSIAAVDEACATEHLLF
ncbi:MAG TPA: hypothetical protein VK442_11745 [Xanthobacteraceae bacterium]|nr:hypothetical protein [Xanthobacteraceae bacterium]